MISQNFFNVKTGWFRIFFISCFGLAVFLLLANIVLSFFTPKQISTETSALSAVEINQLFRKSISEYYLDERYLRQIKAPKKKEDSLLFSYRLILPHDIPVPVFLSSIFGNFYERDVAISSVEIVLNKKSLLEISSGSKEKFYAEIIQDTSIHRNAGWLAFALTNYENLSHENLKKLLEMPESFAFLLHPKKESSEFVKTILDARKEYILELTETSPNSEFMLAEKFPFERNKLAINSLLKYYPRNSFFFVHPSSALLSAQGYDKVRKEFAKRKYKLFSSNAFLNVGEIKEDEFAQRFLGSANILGEGETKLLILPAAVFYASLEKIVNLKKRGIRFIPASTAVVKLKGL